MASRPTRGGGSAPPDDDFDILRGTPREGGAPAAAKAGPVPRSALAGAPAPAAESPPSGPSPADLASALESVAAADRRLEERLAEATRVLASIREFLAGIEALRRSVTEAAEFTGNTRAATAVLQAEAGNQAERLKDGRAALDRAVAALGTRAEDLKAREEALGKGIEELRALWKEADERSKQLKSEIAALANHYGEWKTEAAAHRKDMAALARVIRDGDAGMRESVANNAEAQLELSLKTLANVEKFGNENDRFLKRFQAGGEELLEALRGEAAGIRRWVAPSLSAALVAVGLSFPVLGAWTQSRLGMFEAYDGTGGLKRQVWDRHGAFIEECIDASRDDGKPVRCQLHIDARVYGAAPARLPPVPGGG